MFDGNRKARANLIPGLARSSAAYCADGLLIPFALRLPRRLVIQASRELLAGSAAPAGYTLTAVRAA
jgi:hypothetical protein